MKYAIPQQAAQLATSILSKDVAVKKNKNTQKENGQKIRYTVMFVTHKKNNDQYRYK
jgi:hypothetical protein